MNVRLLHPPLVLAAPVIISLSLIGGVCRADQPPACGATAKEAIASARAALTSKEANAEGKAVACLIQAVSMLESEMPLVKNADGQEALKLPQYSGGAQK
ncbi:hypothetical protein [Rhodopseudomonas sp.]|uniref:hypothetical protein n=1 Tax=Rhodopseudomonas sp. TaxID=1078 RepID=UPI0039E70D42